MNRSELFKGLRAAIRSLAIVITVIFGVMDASADHYTDYIEKYSDIAVEQQDRYGIPASITLAQGLLESGAGRSTLATEGNNHFGIKCHSDWTGASMLRNDDAPDECFRVYDNARQSFEDHSRFLSRKRYAPLFEHAATDYVSWARTLRECGYATDPNYADKLITIIERYTLYAYDTPGGRQVEETAGYILEHLRTSHVIRRSRGLHYVVATPGDTYSGIAREFNMPLKKILAYNDVNKDGRIRAWEEVYLEEKKDEGPGKVKKATIGEDESMHSISQRYGMKLSSLKALNPKAKDKPGQKLKLR
ncbi:MAG: glucosaminidase domain-containing protein [Lachnospiraceae bacterium]|nr:glucosaminidase domain-containing protein [Lachnospiraceae bacterium]